MFPSILIRTGVFRDRFAVNAISYVSQICLNKCYQFSNLKKFSKLLSYDQNIFFEKLFGKLFWIWIRENEAGLNDVYSISSNLYVAKAREDFYGAL